MILAEGETGFNSYNDKSGTDVYLWPDSVSYFMIGTGEGYTLDDLELWPADAGEIGYIGYWNDEHTQGTAGLSLTAPAILRLRGATPAGAAAQISGGHPDKAAVLLRQLVGLD